MTFKKKTAQLLLDGGIPEDIHFTLVGNIVSSSEQPCKRMKVHWLLFLYLILRKEDDYVVRNIKKWKG